VHVIELAQQGPLVTDPAEDDAVGVGEHQADRLGGQGPVESRQHLLAAFEEQGVLIEGAGEDRFDLLQRDAVLLAPLPRRQQAFGESLDGRDIAAERAVRSQRIVQLRACRQLSLGHGPTPFVARRPLRSILVSPARPGSVV
jgi:hypothetical protein